MKTSLHRHKAITGSVAAFALALAWVIPAATAGADPTDADPPTYNVAVQPYPKPSVDDYNMAFDVAVITPDGDSDITDQQIQIYIERAEELFRRDTGKPFNFIINDVKRGSTQETVVAEGYLSSIGAEAAALYGHTAYGEGDLGHYLYGSGNRLLVLAPANEYLPGDTDTKLGYAFGAYEEGLRGSGWMLVTLPTSVYTRFGGEDPNPLLTETFVGVLQHEIGHLFGLGHATRMICPSAPAAATWNEASLGECSYPIGNSDEDYLDTYSVMGSQGTVLNQTFQYALGMLEQAQVVVIDSPVSNQQVTLRSPTGTQGAEVVVVSDPAAGIDYTLEYRQTAGISSRPNFGDGVYVLRLTDLYYTYFYQASPYNGEMSIGDTFVSADGVVRATLVSQTADHAVLSITRGISTGPTLSVSPESISFDAAASHATVAVSTNQGPFTVTVDANWLVASGTNGSFVVVAGANTTASPRTAVVTVSAGKATPVTMTVTQAGRPAVVIPPVSITGTPTVGQTLTAVVGTTTPSTATKTFQWYRGTKVILGATSSQYTLVAADAGQQVKVRVTASASGYATTSADSPAVAVAVAAPTLSVSPTAVSLGAAAGTSTVTVSTNQSAFDAVPNVTWLSVVKSASSFTVTAAANTGTSARTGTVTVTAGSATPVTVTVTQAGQPAVTIPSVSITGTATVGQTLTAVVGTTTPSTATKTFQWYRGSTAIPGATGSQYTLVAADAGQQVKVKVTASATGYTTSTVESQPVTVAAAPTLSVSPTAVSLGAAAGTSTVTVSTNQGTFSVTESASWLTVSQTTSSFTVIATANTSSQARTAVVTVSAGNASSVAVTVTQAGQPAVTIPSVSITGTATVGQTLTAVVGTTTPSTATKTFQWYRGSTAIPGATGSQYTLVAADAGQQVKVKVTASATGYTTSTVESPAVTVAASTTPTLSVSTRSLKVGAALGSTSEVVTVATNQSSWQVVSNTSWLTVSQVGMTFTVIANAANLSSSPRMGTIRVMAGSAASITIVVTQAGQSTVTPTLSVSPTAVSLGAAAGTSTVTVSTNQSAFDAVPNVTWLSVAKSTTSFTVTAAANISASARTGTVTVTAGSATPVTVTVTQAGQPAVTIPSVSITGTATVGQTLTAVVGTTTPSTATKTFQWYRGSTAIPGATGSQYTLVAADAGQQVKVKVTASATGYTTSTVESPAVTVATVVAGPGVSGTVVAKDGGSLSGWQVRLEYWSCTNTTVSGRIGAETVYSYVAADGSFAGGANATNCYRLTVINPGGGHVAYPLNGATGTTAVVAAGATGLTLTVATRAALGSVSISGTPATGSKLTAVVTGLEPSNAVKTYQWLSNGVAISGATASTYTVKAGAVGASLSVRVTVSHTGMGSDTKTSPSVRVVQ